MGGGREEGKQQTILGINSSADLSENEEGGLRNPQHPE